MKLVSWNVNGLRSVQKKNFSQWFDDELADIVCLQEIKVSRSQIESDHSLIHPGGYSSSWHCALKAGYSGLVTYSRKEPLAVREGLGAAEFDVEGRWLEVDFKRSDFFPKTSGQMTVINSYFPNSQRDHARLPFKLRFCQKAQERLQALRQLGNEVYICGDFNIAHKEIDLKNPKTNTKNAGFLPEERAWLDTFTELGWIDTFRHFEKGPGHYTWWSYRPGVREKNIGWRLDYFFSNPEAVERLKASSHCPLVLGSDHCPVRLSLRT